MATLCYVELLAYWQWDYRPVVCVWWSPTEKEMDTIHNTVYVRRIYTDNCQSKGNTNIKVS